VVGRDLASIDASHKESRKYRMFMRLLIEPYYVKIVSERSNKFRREWLGEHNLLTLLHDTVPQVFAALGKELEGEADYFLDRLLGTGKRELSEGRTGGEQD
jgi:hypothetical protein